METPEVIRRFLCFLLGHNYFAYGNHTFELDGRQYYKCVHCGDVKMEVKRDG